MAEGPSDEAAARDILIVDGNADVLRRLEQLFLEAGFHVTAVADGERARDQLTNRFFPIVLLDLDTPRPLGGIELLQFAQAVVAAVGADRAQPPPQLRGGGQRLPRRRHRRHPQDRGGAALPALAGRRRRPRLQGRPGSGTPAGRGGRDARAVPAGDDGPVPPRDRSRGQDPARRRRGLDHVDPPQPRAAGGRRSAGAGQAPGRGAARRQGLARALRPDVRRGPGRRHPDDAPRAGHAGDAARPARRRC